MRRAVVVHDEVDVALTESGVGVGEAVPLLGQRADRLREQGEPGDPDRELAPSGGHHRAVDAHPVAAVEVVEGAVDLLAHDVGAHEELDVAVTILEGREAQLALRSEQHDPAGEAHAVLGLGARWEVGVGGADLTGGVRALEPHRVGLDPGAAQVVELLEPEPPLLGHERGREGGLLGNARRLVVACHSGEASGVPSRGASRVRGVASDCCCGWCWQC